MILERMTKELPIGLALLLLVAAAVAWAQETAAPEEIEITAELTKTLESQTASPEKAAALYDRLAFGKGRFVKIDGKSRKSAVLALAGQNQCLVRLFDLPVFDSKLLSAGTEYHFGGVLSKIEKTAQGTAEVSITYSNLSEVPGRFYSRQAQDFVRRTQQLRQQNQRIQDQVSQPASAENKPSLTSSSAGPANPQSANSPGSAKPQTESSKPPSATTSPSSSPESSQRSDGQKPKEEDDSSEEASEPAPRNRPVLKRRVESDRTPAEAEPSTGPPPAASGQTSADDDVVIYRRRDGSRQSSSGASTAPPPSETSDRPVLRRKQVEHEHEEKEKKEDVDGMKLIPEGYVTLGSDDAAEAERSHKVLVKPFYLDKYEVTNLDYKQFCDATGQAVPPYWKNGSFPKELEKHPVVQVSWLQAQAYARWAGKRLPTEAEWERAAKGPNSYRYSYGNAYDPRKSNTEQQKTTAVGSYSANEFGIFDMTGNVFEWTSSAFAPYPYQESDGREDPKTPGPRVIRGGAHSSNERDSRCLVRQSDLPENGSPLLGFRCARDAN
jgi:formylglycine-generating enzyme required for sulfatase activity